MKVHIGLVNRGADFIYLFIYFLRIFSNPGACTVDSLRGVVGLSIFSYVT